MRCPNCTPESNCNRHRRRTPEERARMAEASRAVHAARSEEERQQLNAKVAAGVAAAWENDSVRDRSTPESRARISEASRRTWAERDEAENQRIIDAGRCRKGPSQPELQVRHKLETAGQAFQEQVKIGRFTVDFLVGDRQVIEVFGCYWHCCVACGFEDRHDKRSHDQERLALIAEQGYTVTVLWEHDLDTWLDAEEIPE